MRQGQVGFSNRASRRKNQQRYLFFQLFRAFARAWEMCGVIALVTVGRGGAVRIVVF
jgi:hypothetical protein